MTEYWQKERLALSNVIPGEEKSSKNRPNYFFKKLGFLFEQSSRRSDRKIFEAHSKLTPSNGVGTVRGTPIKTSSSIGGLPAGGRTKLKLLANCSKILVWLSDTLPLTTHSFATLVASFGKVETIENETFGKDILPASII